MDPLTPEDTRIPTPPTTQQERPGPPQAGLDNAWEDTWLREHWADNPRLTSVAYEHGIIGARAYLRHTRDAWLEDTARLLVASVARTLTLEQAARIAMAA